MSRRLKTGLFVLLLACLCLVTGAGRWASPAHAQDSGLGLREAERSVVRVMVLHLGENDAPLSLVGGTGFVVAPGKVITNFHVISPPTGTLRTLYYVVPDKFAGDVGKDAQVLQSWPEADLALLGSAEITAPPLKIAATPPGKEAVVRALGYPGVTDRMRNLPLAKTLEPSEPYVTSGSIALFSDTAPGGAQIDTIFHTAAIDHGNSGGPLLDECDRVIGVNTWGASDTLADDGSVESHQGQFAAIRSSILAKFLAKSGVTAAIDYSPCVKAIPVDPALVAQVDRANAATATAVAAAAKAEKERDQLVRYGLIGLGVLAAIAILALVLRSRQPAPTYRASADGEEHGVSAPPRRQIPIVVWILVVVLIGAGVAFWFVSHPGDKPVEPQAPTPTTLTLVCTLAKDQTFNPVSGAGPLTIRIDPATGCVNGRTPYEHTATGFLRFSVSDNAKSGSRLELTQDLKTFTRRDFTLRDDDYQAYAAGRKALGAMACPVPGDAASAKAVADAQAKMRALSATYLNTESARIMTWRCEPQAGGPAPGPPKS